jgi:hypothetical protein
MDLDAVLSVPVITLTPLTKTIKSTDPPPAAMRASIRITSFSAKGAVAGAPMFA